MVGYGCCERAVMKVRWIFGVWYYGGFLTARGKAKGKRQKISIQRSRVICGLRELTRSPHSHTLRVCEKCTC
jgi:hypothetical protein